MSCRAVVSLLVLGACVLSVGIGVVGAGGAAEDGLGVKAVVKEDRVVVTVGGKLFTCYKFGKEQKYPYFWPVNGPAEDHGRQNTIIKIEPETTVD